MDIGFMYGSIAMALNTVGFTYAIWVGSWFSGADDNVISSAVPMNHHLFIGNFLDPVHSTELDNTLLLTMYGKPMMSQRMMFADQIVNGKQLVVVPKGPFIPSLAMPAPVPPLSMFVSYMAPASVRFMPTDGKTDPGITYNGNIYVVVKVGPLGIPL